MTRWPTFLAAACVLAAAAPIPLSIEGLFTVLTEAETLDSADEEIASQLAGVPLTSPLTSGCIQVLKMRGAGPLTLQALELLLARSAALVPPDEPFVSLDPVPDVPHEQEMKDRIATYASGYVHALPNFLCVETTRYYTRKKDWHLEQKITEDVRFHDGAEEYRTRLVNDRPNTAPLDEIRGSFSRGEFGTILGQTFDPASQTQFQWDHWEVIQGKRLAVFNYYVARAHSQYMVCCISAGSMTVGGIRRQQRKTWASAYRGLIYADPDTGAIERLTYRNVEIPPGYNIDDARNLMDYAPVMLNGKMTWLPRRVLHYTRQGDSRTRSEIEFSNFHGFQANSTIQFPTEDAPPK